MNDQNTADKDLLTIEELAAHAIECEKEEAEASAPADAVAADETPAEEEAPAADEETTDSDTEESLSQKLRDFVDDEESKPVKIGPLFKALIGGDGLSRVIARNWVFITVLVFFSCCYVTSRYMMQNATLERNTLLRMLADRKYKALTASSEYLEKTRSNYIESNLKDTTIRSSSDMPFSLKIENGNSIE